MWSTWAGLVSCPAYAAAVAADQVLQLLWKAQPDDAAKQAMPYKGKLQQLLGDEPHYQLAPDPISGRMWVQLQVGSIKRLLNF